MRKKIVAGNWKMNKDIQEGVTLALDITSGVQNNSGDVEVILIPSYIHLSAVKGAIKDSNIKLGAQNCHSKEGGAYTGEVAASMLESVELEYCLVGHSERRIYNRENDEELLAKLKALLKTSICPIFCCGESLEERKSNRHFSTIEQQLEILWNLGIEEFERITIAYEPVWAIGTGETASAEQAQEMHAFIRELIANKRGEATAESTSILYGGSCKPSNASDLFSNKDVDGGLIGGASLNPDDFIAIINALEA